MRSETMTFVCLCPVSIVDFIWSLSHCSTLFIFCFAHRSPIPITAMTECSSSFHSFCVCKCLVSSLAHGHIHMVQYLHCLIVTLSIVCYLTIMYKRSEHQYPRHIHTHTRSGLMSIRRQVCGRYGH